MSHPYGCMCGPCCEARYDPPGPLSAIGGKAEAAQPTIKKSLIVQSAVIHFPFTMAMAHCGAEITPQNPASMISTGVTCPKCLEYIQRSFDAAKKNCDRLMQQPAVMGEGEIAAARILIYAFLSEPAERVVQKLDELAAAARASTALRATVATLQAELDPPVCRLQLPDGSVPVNARAAAEAWHRIAGERASDADVLQAELHTMAKDNLRLRRIVKTLPVTADGVPIVSGMAVWSGKSATRHLVESVSGKSFVVICDCHGEKLTCVSSDVPCFEGGKEVPLPLAHAVYSTRAAALAASTPAAGKDT